MDDVVARYLGVDRHVTARDAVVSAIYVLKDVMSGRDAWMIRQAYPYTTERLDRASVDWRRDAARLYEVFEFALALLWDVGFDG